MNGATARNPGRPTLRIQRSLTFQADGPRILDAWCDPGVQARILAGAADPAGSSGDATLWEIRVPLGQKPQVRLHLDARDATSARHRAEGDGGFQLRSRLATLPARGRPGTEVSLEVEFHADGFLTGLLSRRADPAPLLLAGQALRRLREWVEAGNIQPAASGPQGGGDGSG